MKPYLRKIIEKKIFRKDGDAFIAAFNAIAKGKAEAQLIGSILTKGVSEHDIDVKINIVDNEWADKKMDEYEGEKPFYYEFMIKMGAKLISTGNSYYTGKDQTGETDEWNWKGFLIDVIGEYE